MKRTLLLAPILCGALLLLPLACDKDLSDPGDPEEETVQEFLNRLMLAYSTMDSVAYETLLDSMYRFEPLSNETIPDDPEPWIDREEELALVGRMFHGRYNAAGVKVDGIELDLHPKGDPVVDDSLYEGRPAGETWHRMTVFVGLTVVTQNPNATNGSGIVNYIVTSDQIFVVRREPNGAGRFLIVRQIDQEPIGKTAGAPGGVEETSWGAIKLFFLPRVESYGAWAEEIARAYTEADSVAYGERIDAGYRFQLLPEDADKDNPGAGWWDRSEELAIAGRMFHERQNEETVMVTDIVLEIDLVSDPVADGTQYPGRSAGVFLYRVTAAVDLSVVTLRALGPNGPEYVEYIVEGEQSFVLRRDLVGSGKYMIFKQTDLGPAVVAPVKPPYRTERATWGSVKKLFR